MKCGLSRRSTTYPRLDNDGAEPSANSVSALNLLRLGHYFDDSSLLDRLRQLFKSYTRQLTRLPMTMPTMIRCLELYNAGMNEILIQSSDPEEISRIRTYLQTSYLPNMIVVHLNKAENKLLAHNKHLQAFANDQSDEKTRIFLCRNFQCQLPVSSLDELKEKLRPLILKH